MGSTHSMDLTKGSVTKKLLFFAIPILLTNLLQHLYGVADRVIVGQFAVDGEVALAAVGSTSAATTLILNIFNGLAIGANVICANLRGARKQKELSQCMHTSIALAAVSGLAVGIIGIFISKPMLRLMATPEDVLDSATLYMQIYFVGVPASLLYNYGAGILRAHGDTKRPMFILSLSGIVNVVLNIVLVVGFGRSVDGVAIATVVSQILSAAAVLWILFSPRGEFKLRIRSLRFHKKQVASVIRVGIPCGLNGVVFSLSNVIIQSSVNSFNSTIIIAGKTAATDISSLIYQLIAAFYSACISFSGQCYGAKQYRRIDSLVIRADILCMSMIAVLSVIVTIFPRQLLGMFNSNPQVIEAGINIVLINSWGYLIYSASEIFLGCLRGMGRSAIPTLLNLVGICVPRVIWATAVFPMHRTIEMLYLCYPLSWCISAVMMGMYYVHCRRKINVREVLQTK